MRTQTTKRHTLLRWGCGALTAALLLGGALGASALDPTHADLSGGFRGSRYYLNLQYLQLTGDGATDVIMVAMSQLGYHEGNRPSETNGESSYGSGNHVEYNYLYGTVDQEGNGKQTYAYPWCASFVSYCARMAGVEQGVLPAAVNCTWLLNHFRSTGNYRTRSSGYIPQKGDLIFFRSAGSSRASTHVGLVRYTCNGVVYTIEGNCNNEVSLAAYHLQDVYIVGYGTPDYASNPQSAYTYLLDVYSEGNYIIAAEQLPVYDRPAGERQTFMLRRGDLMHVYEASGAWGRTDYGWIHLPDTQPVDVR